MKFIFPTLAALAIASPVVAQDLFTAGQYDDYTPDIGNGEVVFNASGCAACHGIDGDDGILAGGTEFRTRFGTLFAPNITAHPQAGIGEWSRSDFLNAVLRGTAPDGGAYFGAVFPFPAFSRMRPEDALDMQAYMATLPQSDAPSSDHQISYLDQFVLNLWSDERAPLPSTGSAQRDRGAYLVEAMGHCGECHSRRSGTLSTELDPDGAFAGETGMIAAYAPAINAAALTGPGRTPETLVNGSLVEGLTLNGLPMTNTFMRRMARATARLGHEDRVAMYAYLAGTDIDPASVTRVSVETGSQPIAASSPEPEAMPDLTGATGILGRIEAYCAIPDEAPAVETVAAPAAGAADPALESAANEVLETHCRTCHARGMTNQRSFFTGSMRELASDRSAVVPGDHEASRLWESIASNRMPTGRLPRVSGPELQTLEDWINSLAVAEAAPVAASASPAPELQTAEMPRFIGGTFLEMSAAAVADLGAMDELDRAYIRYFSFANVPLPEVDCTLEGALRNPVHYLHAALNKFVNSVSRGPILTRIEPVEGTDGALVRIDIRDFGWTAEDWDALTMGVYTRGAEEAGFSQQAWDDLVTVYPYAIDPGSDPMLGVLSGYSQANVPILNADWFTRHASEAPYYDMLLRLPPHIAQLEQRMGVDVESAIMGLRTIRTGFTAQFSGVSDHNRLLERFDLPGGGYYWKSYDFAGDEGLQSLIEHPDGPPELSRTASGTAPFEHDGGEMIFTLPNGMQGYYLSLADGTRITEGPTNIVSFRARPVGQGVEIVNARSCFTCHDNGVITKQDQMRGFIESSALFSRQQREILLRMYPEQSVIDDWYRRDIELFLGSLSTLGVTQTTVAGRQTSLMSPDGGEIVTWLADHRFARLDEEMLARLFFLTPEELRYQGQRLGDPHLQQILAGWLNRFDQNLMVTIEEVDAVWSAMLPRLSPLRGLEYGAYAQAATYEAPPAAAPSVPYEQAAVQAVSQAVAAAQQPYEAPAQGTAYAPPAVNPDPLQILLRVPRQTVHVNELLTFDVETNRSCSLQVLYVAANRDVLILSESAVGPAVLQAGERRQIPYPGGGRQLRFDEPGTGEFLAAYCREPGSTQPPMSVEQVVARARQNYQPPTRSLVEEAQARTEADEGRSGFATVSIDVLP